MKTTVHHEWKEIAGNWWPKLQDIYSQFSSIWWKGDNNRIWFQTKDDIMMELDRIWFVELKSRNWHPAMTRAPCHLTFRTLYCLPNIGMIMYKCQNWVTKLADSKEMTDITPAPKTTILWLSLFVNADEIGAETNVKMNNDNSNLILSDYKHNVILVLFQWKGNTGSTIILADHLLYLDTHNPIA